MGDEGTNSFTTEANLVGKNDSSEDIRLSITQSTHFVASLRLKQPGADSSKAFELVTTITSNEINPWDHVKLQFFFYRERGECVTEKGFLRF